MRRPSFMRAPAFVLRIMLGEMADALLLTGQRAVPAKAVRHGFTFTFPTIDAALDSMFQRRG
jgi:NAD dependent epimerase/dehydratase family enzyme